MRTEEIIESDTRTHSCHKHTLALDAAPRPMHSFGTLLDDLVLLSCGRHAPGDFAG